MSEGADPTLIGYTANDEKIKLDGADEANAASEFDDSKAKFINGGDTTHVEISDGRATPSETEFNGLGKEEVMKYANDPFWTRLRWILFILFWVGWLAMLVTAIVIIILAPRCPPRPDLKWYQTDTIYQVLPKSFKDSDGDGVGDLEGLKSQQKDYLNEYLGSNAVWLDAYGLFKTDGEDSGLGIIDHKALDPKFGDMSTFRSWLRKMKKEGKKVIIDFVPNQTSKNHTWWQKSVNEEGKYKDYYVWSSSKPNSWQNAYNEDAWEMDSVRNEYYLHQFSKDHPDLNLNNEDVREELKEIMKFWLDAGVSGFHIVGLEYLTENATFKENTAGTFDQTRNFPKTLELLKEWRKLINSYSDKPGREKLLFGTVTEATGNETLSYFGTKKDPLLHIVAPLMKDLDDACDAACIHRVIEESLTDADNHKQWLGRMVGGPNVQRIGSRMASDKKLIVVHALQLLLPGTPFNYYGDEFGQQNGNVPAKRHIDTRLRDNYRTPMQWNNMPNAGFCDKNVKPWLPVGAGYITNNMEAGRAHLTDKTPLRAFVDLVELRKKESFQWGKTTVCATPQNVLLVHRKAEGFPSFIVAANFGNVKTTISFKEEKCVPSSSKGEIIYHSHEDELDLDADFHDRYLPLQEGAVSVIQFD